MVRGFFRIAMPIVAVVLLLGLSGRAAAQAVIVQPPATVVYSAPLPVVAPAPVVVTRYQPAILPWRRVAVTYAAPVAPPVVAYPAPLLRPRVVRYYSAYYYPW